MSRVGEIPSGGYHIYGNSIYDKDIVYDKSL